MLIAEQNKVSVKRNFLLSCRGNPPFHTCVVLQISPKSALAHLCLKASSCVFVFKTCSAVLEHGVLFYMASIILYYIFRVTSRVLS